MVLEGEREEYMTETDRLVCDRSEFRRNRQVSTLQIRGQLGQEEEQTG
jgi:hypothetical protein